LVCSNGACNPISYNISFNKTACLISAADVGAANISITNISSSKVGISFENGPYGTKATHSALAFIGVNTYAIKIVDSNNVGCPRVDTTIQVAGLNPISKQPTIGILGALCTSDSSMHTIGVFNANSEAEYFLLFKNIDTMPFAKLNRNMSDTLTFSKISKLSVLKSGDIIRAVAVDTATLCSKPSPSIPIMVFTSPKAGFTAAINDLTVSFTDTTFQTSKRDWMFMGAIPDALNGAVTISKTFPSAGKKTVMMKMTDVNGCEEKASAEITLNNVGLNELTQVMPLRIHPNPVGSELYYTLAGTEDAHVMVYDMKGKLVKQQVVKDAENRVDVQMLTPGLYMIYLSQSNNNYFTKFMKD
jgi:Secretion system C-terminal sorting domain